MVRGVGVDIVDIDRFRKAAERWRERFLTRLFSEDEVEECRRWRDPVPHLAVKFAAKEAFGKALGTGLGGTVSLRDVQVLHDTEGGARLVVSGKLKEWMKKRKMDRIFLSLSHDGGLGIAFVIVEG